MDVRGETTIGGTRLAAVQADLPSMDVDVVVNAANEHLVHGGGVAAALARAGGPDVQAESSRWVAANGPVRPGQAAVTTAGDIPARNVVHVVGPRFRQGQDNAVLLRQAVEAALGAVLDSGGRTVAMPAISAGIFGYPPEEATRVIARAAAGWLGTHPGIDEVLLVGFDAEMADRFAGAIAGL